MGKSVEHNCGQKSARKIAGASLRPELQESYHPFPKESNWIQDCKGVGLWAVCKLFTESIKPCYNPLRHFARAGIEEGQDAIRLDASSAALFRLRRLIW